MSGALPYPTSDNRSVISGIHHAGSYAYASAYDRDTAQLKSLAPRPQQQQHQHQYPGVPPPRHHGGTAQTSTATPTDMSYAAHANGRQLLVSGTSLGRTSDQDRPAHVSQAYHDSLSYRDHPPYAHMHPGGSGPMYASSEDSRLGGYPSRSYEHALSEDSHSSTSRSPPAQQETLPAIRENEQQPNKTSGKRREKPRIELAPDQPLTTQGKPRARVYVACIQWSAAFFDFACVFDFSDALLSLAAGREKYAATARSPCATIAVAVWRMGARSCRRARTTPPRSGAGLTRTQVRGSVRLRMTARSLLTVARCGEGGEGTQLPPGWAALLPSPDQAAVRTRISRFFPWGWLRMLLRSHSPGKGSILSRESHSMYPPLLSQP